MEVQIFGLCWGYDIVGPRLRNHSANTSVSDVERGMKTSVYLPMWFDESVLGSEWMFACLVLGWGMI